MSDMSDSSDSSDMSDSSDTSDSSDMSDMSDSTPTEPEPLPEPVNPPDATESATPNPIDTSSAIASLQLLQQDSNNNGVNDLAEILLGFDPTALW